MGFYVFDKRGMRRFNFQKLFAILKELLDTKHDRSNAPFFPNAKAEEPAV